MQNDLSGARAHHRKPKDREVLSATESAALERGQTLKRYVRAAAALNEIYDDTALGDAVDLGRGAVGDWWTKSRPGIDTIHKLAKATGLSRDELIEFVHYDGPPPTLPDPATLPIRAGIQRAEQHLADKGPGTPSPQPEQRSRGTGAGRG